MKFAVVALLLLLGPSTVHADTKPPALTPIKAVFVQKEFATTYTATAKDADGDKLTQTWTLAPPAKDPKCNVFKQQSATSAVWQHGDFNHCNHALQGPRGHTGTVTFKVTDGTWTCTETYAGTITGNGGVATCKQAAKPGAYTCSGGQVKVFDNSNGFGVSNGGTSPSFDTKGTAYCLTSITTYHWNDMKGAKPGTIALSTAGGLGHRICSRRGTASASCTAFPRSGAVRRRRPSRRRSRPRHRPVGRAASFRSRPRRTPASRRSP